MKKMKISTLFHWLYGLLMLAPVFAIGSTILVNTFNKEVTQETQRASINYKYETNDVGNNLSQDLVLNNIYHIDTQNMYTYSMGDYIVFESGDFLNLSVVNITTFYIDVNALEDYGIDEIISNDINISYDTGIFLMDTYFTITTPSVDSYITSIVYIPIDNVVFEGDFILNDYQFSLNVNDNFFSRCENVPIESVDIETTPSSNNDIFYYSVDKVTKSSYFCWAYDSFLAEPLQYIVVLFSMPVDSPVVLLMSYWLVISIIWLVFDVIMYVPLLVHRWIDKGGIE